MTIKQQLILTSNYKKTSNILLGVGSLALLLGIIFLAFGNDELQRTRFWAVLLQNSTYFLLVVNAAMFFICISTMAMGGWQIAFRRIPEAISSLVPLYGVLVLIVLLGIILGHQHHIYHWLDTEHVKHDTVLTWKSPFLNPTFFIVWTIFALLAWILLGKKMRSLSAKTDEKPLNKEQGKKFIWDNTVWASIFVVLFALTVGSTIPWLWIMSIDAHWYSTMYSWYTFSSTFVSGIALIVLVVIYLKQKDYLEFVNKDHLHDLGKFMFAFSIFWAYLWFSQYMLIWYANIPEETTYFKVRQQGPYSFIFYCNLVVNFVLPFLLLMRYNEKRNYSMLMVVASIIILGHWLDFYQMVMPGPLGANYHLSWFEIGVFIFYVGLTMCLIGRHLTKVKLIPLYHPFLKESIIHHV